MKHQNTSSYLILLLAITIVVGAPHDIKFNSDLRFSEDHISQVSKYQEDALRKQLQESKKISHENSHDKESETGQDQQNKYLELDLEQNTEINVENQNVTEDNSSKFILLNKDRLQQKKDKINYFIDKYVLHLNVSSTTSTTTTTTTQSTTSGTTTGESIYFLLFI